MAKCYGGDISRKESSWKSKRKVKANATGGIRRGATGGIYVGAKVRLGMGYSA